MTTTKTIEVVISEIDFYLINRVRELRVSVNLSQAKLAILMGLTKGVIGKIENPRERAKYSIRHITLLAKAFRCSPQDLLPEKPLKNDMIRARIKIMRNKKKPHRKS
jgi:transcriptional regulator with XRE-family HTH domain